jgi:hypothetical protein
MAGRSGAQLLASEGGPLLVERAQAELTGPQHAAGVAGHLACTGLREPPEGPDAAGGRATEGRRLGEPLGRQPSGTGRPDPARQPGPEEECVRQLRGTSRAHPCDDALRPSQERGGWLTGSVPGCDRKEVGIHPVDVPGLCAQEQRTLVGCRHGAVPVVRRQCRSGDRHQQVGLLARLERPGHEGGLDDGQRILCEPAGQVGRHLVEDEVDAGHAERVEERGRGGVLLERARQVVAEEGEPSGVVLGDGESGHVVEGRRDLAEARERLGRGLDLAELDVDQGLQVEHARLPHLVVGAGEQLTGPPQVRGTLLEAGEQVPQHVRAPVEHPGERNTVEHRGSLVEVPQSLLHATNDAQRDAQGRHHLSLAGTVARSPGQPLGGAQLVERSVGVTEVTQHDRHDLVADRGERGVRVGHEDLLSPLPSGLRIGEEVAEELLRVVAIHAAILADLHRKLSETPRRETRATLASDHVR